MSGLEYCMELMDWCMPPLCCCIIMPWELGPPIICCWGPPDSRPSMPGEGKRGSSKPSLGGRCGGPDVGACEDGGCAGKYWMVLGVLAWICTLALPVLALERGKPGLFIMPLGDGAMPG